MPVPRRLDATAESAEGNRNPELRHVGVEKLPDTMLIALARQEAT
jgi:hypothetical protein